MSNIAKIRLKNFVSYKEGEIEFGPNLNVIVGKNGSGKTSIINALLWVFSEEFADSNNRELQNAHEEGSNMMVKVTLANLNQSLPYETKEVEFERERSTKDQVQVNGKRISFQNLRSLLSKIKINTSNLYNVVRQGKVTSITKLNATGLYHLLEEVCGITEFKLILKNAVASLNDQLDDKESMTKELKEMSSEVKKIQADKLVFEQSKVLVEQIKSVEAQLKKFDLVSAEAQFLEKQKQYEEVRQRFLDGKKSQADLGEQLRTLDQNIAELQQKEVITKKQHKNHSDQLRKLKNKSAELRSAIQVNKQQLEQDEKYDQSTLVAQREEANAIIKEHSYKQIEIESHLKILKILQTPDPAQAIKDLLQTEVPHLTEKQNQLETLTADLTPIEKRLQQAYEKKDVNTNQLRLLHDDYQAKQKEALAQQTKANKQIQELEREKIEMEIQLNSLNADLDTFSKQFNKMVKDPYTSSMINVLKYAQEENLKVFGVFADLIEIEDQSMLPMFETAAGLDFYSLIVPDWETSKKLINFNNKCKGGDLRIIVLDLLNNQQNEEFHLPEQSFLLSSQITLRDGIPQQNALINQIIGRWLCVKDYQAALKIAKQYRVNCITFDCEVVYADSYFTKVGSTEIKVSGTSVLKKVFACCQAIEAQEKALEQIMEKQIKLNEVKNELGQQIQDNLSQIEQFTYQLNLHDEASIQMAEKKQQNLQMKIQHLSAETKVKQQFIGELRKKLQNPKQLKKGLSDQQIKQYEQLFKDQEISKGLVNGALQQLNLIDQYMKVGKLSDNERVNIIQSIERSEVEIQQMEMEIDHLESKVNMDSLAGQINDLEIQCSKVRQLQNQNKFEINQLEIEYVGLEKDFQTVRERLEQAMQENKIEIGVFQQVDVELTRPELLEKLSNLRKQQKRQFTAYHEWLFSQIDEFSEKVYQLNKEFDRLIEFNLDFKQIMSLMQDKCEEMTNKQFFEKFKQNFQHYFNQLVPRGTCDVKLVKVASEDNQFGIEILCSFLGLETKNWMSASMGQRTVIAFLILISLQMVEPAPFYVLDEIDDSLDQNYRSKMVEIIRELSQQRQYIIITHNVDLLKFDDDSVKYFKIATQPDSYSAISVIKRTEALKLVTSSQA